MKNLTVECGNIKISNTSNFCLIAGPCQLETEQHAMDMSGKIKEILFLFDNSIPLQLTILFIIK